MKLEEAQGLIVKLTAQVNHNYENSSLPSSKCIGRKKITNNREKTRKKPGAQAGHPHHPRKPMKPDQVIEIAAEEKFKDSSRYVPTGNVISRQVIGISIVPVVTELNIIPLGIHQFPASEPPGNFFLESHLRHKI